MKSIKKIVCIVAFILPAFIGQSQLSSGCTSLIWSCGDGEYSGACVNVGGDPTLPCANCGCVVDCGVPGPHCPGGGGGGET